MRTNHDMWDITEVKRPRRDCAHAARWCIAAVGSQVGCAINWERRYRLMRTHTALHLLCGVVFRDYGALVTGGNMDLDEGRLDFEITDFSNEVSPNHRRQRQRRNRR
jgi:misacylated tRNA(Ala) deacylase